MKGMNEQLKKEFAWLQSKRFIPHKELNTTYGDTISFTGELLNEWLGVKLTMIIAITRKDANSIKWICSGDLKNGLTQSAEGETLAGMLETFNDLIKHNLVPRKHAKKNTASIYSLQ